MKISLITPAKKSSKNGNRTTALRWARILRDLGHHVDITVTYDGQKADLMIALHAWRSAAAITTYRKLYPDQPLILALTGTDINEFIHSDPKPTLASMETADALVCLHDLVVDVTPKKFRKKLNVIYQSAPALSRKRKSTTKNFDICLIGHMRDVKDPLRGAMALRGVPESSKLRLIHLGKAHNKAWEKKGRAEMKRNPRYIWQGEKAGWEVRKELARTNLMLISSVSEGGANVVSEALVAGVPVIASKINGNVGMLGKDYPGYYPVGDEKALRKLLLKCESDAAFMRDLSRRCKVRAKLFKLAEEKRRWKKLLAEIVN
ncbi:MAG: TIGR04348 family glycosyltransferase [Rhodospirillaceae bacterium]|jgi:putative glycosyltransferase (TIGR04348 family)|nr:TIGR04348 family glycosyltransferase [Rhodospirillaceae bacterium]MBT4938610.1 TIGR04348 family glycosyltransferase [Rhodospirillaceae bacterium]MBT5941910.1 TIGR04348 family glycosyltransferase [Rhodospirillaceae bacterium]MBT7267964.1 TIGR04348 family glycosyltransferase [Rhodospirillaceae bacterium]